MLPVLVLRTPELDLAAIRAFLSRLASYIFSSLCLFLSMKLVSPAFNLTPAGFLWSLISPFKLEMPPPTRFGLGRGPLL